MPVLSLGDTIVPGGTEAGTVEATPDLPWILAVEGLKLTLAADCTGWEGCLMVPQLKQKIPSEVVIS